MVDDVSSKTTTKNKRLIGLAAAPDFGKDLYNALNKKQKEITIKVLLNIPQMVLAIT